MIVRSFPLSSWSPSIIYATEIPIVWDCFLSESDRDYDRAMTTHQNQMDLHHQKLAEWEKHRSAPGKGKAKAKPPPKPVPPTQPRRRLHEDEPVNFLRLTTALKLFLSRIVSNASIQRAAILYEEYLFEYKKVGSSNSMYLH